MSEISTSDNPAAVCLTTGAPLSNISVGLLTGGIDKPYAYGLAMALASQSIRLDFIGSDEVDCPKFHGNPQLRFLNLRGDQSLNVSLATKITRILCYYGKLIHYALLAKPRIFHILWNNRFETFDRTLLMLFYKLLGKKIVFTAHNVNAGRRDSTDSPFSRLTLRIQYRLADHIFVHTEIMKNDLLKDFGAREKAVTVIPFGINNAVPDTAITPRQARRRLGIADGEKTILFFGRIAPYKGLDLLVEAFERLSVKDGAYRLIIAGLPKRGAEKYLDDIQQKIGKNIQRGRVIQKIEFTPDEDTELYFKAGDVLVLPYTDIFLSGVLYLGYSFGLPVVACDVGSMADEIVEGKTGFLCKPRDVDDLVLALERYFGSYLYKHLDAERQAVKDYVRERHSWDTVAEMTRRVYTDLLK